MCLPGKLAGVVVYTIERLTLSPLPLREDVAPLVPNFWGRPGRGPVKNSRHCLLSVPRTVKSTVPSQSVPLVPKKARPTAVSVCWLHSHPSTVGDLVALNPGPWHPSPELKPLQPRHSTEISDLTRIRPHTGTVDATLAMQYCTPPTWAA